MVRDPISAATAEPQPVGDDDVAQAGSAAADFDDLKQRLEELGRYLGHYVAVKRDRLLRTVRRRLVLLAGIVFAAIAVVAFLATAGVLFCVGIALAINDATGSPWMGPLFTGLAVLLLLAGGTFWTMHRVDRAALRQFAHKAQLRRAELQVRYGRGIDE